jgi:hypothetical protein
MLREPTVPAPIPGIEFELGGDTYIVPPLNLAAIQSMQARLEGYDGNAFNPQTISTVREAARLALRRNYPDLGKEWHEAWYPAALKDAELWNAESDEASCPGEKVPLPDRRPAAAFLNEFVDVANMQDLFLALMDVSGMRRKEIAAGKAAAASAAAPSIGMGFTAT